MIQLHHTEPDGAVEAPHHHYTGLGIVLCTAAAAGDAVTAFVAFGGMFVFWSMWRDSRPTGYRRLGALLSVLSPLVAAVTAVALAGGYTTYGTASVLLGAYVALDDSIQHALGIPTPLDILWRRYLYPVVVSL